MRYAFSSCEEEAKASVASIRLFPLRINKGPGQFSFGEERTSKMPQMKILAKGTKGLRSFQIHLRSTIGKIIIFCPSPMELIYCQEGSIKGIKKKNAGPLLYIFSGMLPR